MDTDKEGGMAHSIVGVRRCATSNGGNQVFETGLLPLRRACYTA